MFETPLGILNGAIGDYLVRTGNGLATPMAWARGAPTGPRSVVLVPGLMCTEAIWRMPDVSADRQAGGVSLEQDYGALLERDLGLTPAYLRYNTGRSVDENGALLSRLLTEAAEAATLADELTFLGYSMGGLVVRAACFQAEREGQPWLRRVRRVIYLGTPHRGAPLERVSRALLAVLKRIDDPYARLAGELGALRSAGIRDLGEPAGGAGLRAIPQYYVGGSRDLMVPPSWALPAGPERIPPDRVTFLPGLGHLAIARHPQVYAQLCAWCDPDASP